MWGSSVKADKNWRVIDAKTKPSNDELDKIIIDYIESINPRTKKEKKFVVLIYKLVCLCSVFHIFRIC